MFRNTQSLRTAPLTGAQTTPAWPDNPQAPSAWRSEAFTEDMLPSSHGPWVHAEEASALQVLLQCALPVTVALVGGLAAFVSVLN